MQSFYNLLLIDMKMKLNSELRFLFRLGITVITALALFGSDADISARPVTKSKGTTSSPLTFYRQRNTLSNIDFFFTNKGILFNQDAVAGCNWPRGTVNSYIFGGGLWFATKKNISGSKRKLCELGYNPNSGAGWFTEGEIGNPGAGSSQYISYVSPRYSKTDGNYGAGVNAAVPPPYAHWPIWDTSATKTLNRNYYFGDYIASEPERAILAGLADANQPIPTTKKIPKPAILSQEDIVNIYSDQDVSANPEYRAGSGYPFNLNIVEVIYTWSFGKYRDMMFIRRKATNASTTDTLFECFVSPAFDPDLGVGGTAAANDINSYFGLSAQDIADSKALFPPSSPYYGNPTALNMARQWSKTENSAVPPGEYGCIGFTFLESPVTSANGNIIDISDSVAVGGYCNGAKQLGLTTFKQWTIANDPPTPDLRYDFLASGALDHDISIVADMRLLFATGPFTLPPGKSVETTVGIGIARPSTTTVKLNQDSVVKLIAFAHQVFADTTGTYKPGDTANPCQVTVKHFITPVPPDLPNLTTQCLDRAVLVSWDNTADSSKDPLSAKTLAFNTYDLYRTTRSDHDSTIRPTGVNPTVHLGSWSVYNLRQDTVFDILILKNGSTFKEPVGIKYTRLNSTPNKIPHSFLDYGDDNGDGVLTGSEGLFNGVQYYYFLTATDEFDSVNNVGPLTTAVVNQKNFAVGIPCRPVFTDLPNTIAGDSSCLNGSLSANATTGFHATTGTSVTVEIQDTGKFLQLFSNDTITVSFQPRWTELLPDRFLYQSPLNMFVDVNDTRQGKHLTYDILNNPSASPVVTPFSFPSGIFEQVIGMQASPDSNILGRFSTNNNTFQPNQTIDQAFDILVNHDYQQLIEPYRLHSITFDQGNKGTDSIVSISGRTSRAPVNYTFSFSNIPDSITIPSFLGALGESSYEISFGQATQWSEDQFDTLTQTVIPQVSDIKDPNTSADFHPMALPITIKATSHCDQQLSVIRPGNRNDVAVENDYRFYNKTIVQAPNIFPDYTNPDTMVVPIPGKFVMDAFHFAETKDGDPSTATFLRSTSGMYYFSHGLTPSSNGESLETVHRLRLGGAELIFNFAGISNAQNAGDTASYQGPFTNDFQPNDKITVGFTGLVRGLPFPGAQFVIYTSKLDFAANSLYQQSKILNEVQVVPNPYFVEHIGQTSTDNAKLFFTRLPPRATIEIYNLAGQLVKTIEHNGTYTDTTGMHLADRYNVETWNLLSEGLQRVASQVFVARVIAKDPRDGTTVLGEMTTKFAVVLGGYRLVH